MWYACFPSHVGQFTKKSWNTAANFGPLRFLLVIYLFNMFVLCMKYISILADVSLGFILSKKILPRANFLDSTELQSALVSTCSIHSTFNFTFKKIQKLVLVLRIMFEIPFVQGFLLSHFLQILYVLVPNTT